MQRHQDESFSDYKVRRTAANLAVKYINASSKGGSTTSRQHLRAGRDNSKHAGQYGKTLRAHFAKMRAEAFGRKVRTDAVKPRTLPVGVSLIASGLHAA